MTNAGACRSHLKIPAFQNFAITHRVATAKPSEQRYLKIVNHGILLEFSGNNVREDLEFAMSVRAEAGMRLHAILVQNAQATKRVVLLIVVPV